MTHQPILDVLMIAVCGAIIAACGLFGLFYKPRILTRAADHSRWIAFIFACAAAGVLLFLVIGRAAGIP